jgi:hypothetical protein
VIDFSVAFFCCGLGAGARGFLAACAQLGKQQVHHEARFRNLGGIDNDPASCADFELLTGGKATCADLSTMTPLELRRALGASAGASQPDSRRSSTARRS